MASAGMTDAGSEVEPLSTSESDHASINPYASSMQRNGSDPGPLTNSDQVGCFLAFDGEITEDDIRRLIPERELWMILAVLMWGFLIPAFAIGAVVAIINAVREGLDTESVGLIFTCIGVGCGFAIATQYVSSSRRARRALKQRPDLVGRAVGRFVPWGLLFNDGERTHLLNADYCRQAQSTRHGVRVPLLEGPYVQLYLARRLFDRFDAAVWKHLQAIWQQHDATQLDPDAVRERNCQQLGERPESAISFDGQVTLHVPVDQTAVRRIMYRNGGLIVVYGVAMFLAWHFGFRFIAFGVLLLTLSTVRTFYNSWRWTSIPTQETSWRQHGWISPEEVVSVNENNGIRLSREECLRIEWIDETLVWHLRNNRAMYFLREHFQSDEDWNRVRESSSSESVSTIE
ncbi:hypothetical protein [Rhodopirellula sp. P2]|uniref:hypothetical protein n=1 Tax=Rhodopirellula sp. P2 TaxID=2127060 RepID=UPI002367452A|nr:hypothetical protein [Rhodopirellula sp. P2]WDQ15962.1 hypothetical protein PSR62_20335 [Rhodopirellula sp. P2]